jgi:hypothetical protein
MAIEADQGKNRLGFNRSPYFSSIRFDDGQKPLSLDVRWRAAQWAGTLPRYAHRPLNGCDQRIQDYPGALVALV